MKKPTAPIVIPSPKEQIHLFGYDKYFKYFTSLFLNNKIPNCILLSGPKGLGKATFAYHFINSLLSKNEEKPYVFENYMINKDNLSYKLMNSDIHPNFYLVDNKNFDKEIKIEQIRQLLIFLNKSTYSRNLKIILIDNVENLNLSSANALLKSLEEPNNNTFFIIIHNNSFKLLETIKSRTTEFKISFSKNEKEETFHKIIKQNNIKNITNDLNESLHFDTPGNIIKYLLALNTKNQDLNNSNIDNALFFIEKYINDKSYETLSFLKLFIEKFYYYLFLNNKYKINKYFYNYMKILKQIDNMRRFNLDEKNTFISVKSLLINEKR